MNLRDLEYLVAVADHRHFGRAAHACDVRQPTLSAQLKKLEQELGVLLIERQPRNVVMTAVGDRIVDRAREMLRLAQDIATLADQASDPACGTLRFGAFPTLAAYLLPYVTPALREQFPRLQMLLVEEKSADLVAALKSGSLDAAVLATPVDEDELLCANLFREDFVLVTPPDHPLAGDTPLATTALAGLDLLLLDDGHCLRDQVLQTCELIGAQERREFRASTLETLRHMVAGGVGITLMPALALHGYERTARVAARTFAAPAPHRDLALVWRASSPMHALLEQVASILRNAMLTHATASVHIHAPQDAAIPAPL